MTILLSALSRYHVFDLALQLQERALVAGVVTAYPKYKLGHYSALEPSVISLGHFAVARKTALAVERFLGSPASSRIHEMVYSRFSNAVADVARHRAATVVYGLSGYMQEVLDSRAAAGKVTIVDHGSLHIETEKAILTDECARFGFSKFGNWQYEWLVRRMTREFRVADHVVCCSELARTTMIQNGVPDEKIAVHRLGVNLAEFSRQSTRVARAGQGMRLLFVGAMTALKGLHYLLKAFRSLGSDNELWLVGTLPTDPVMKKMIADCIYETGRLKVIGPVPQAQLNSIYNECNVFVLPSLSDGWGMVVSQALACGLPVVVSDMTGSKELVTQGHNGFVVESRNVADLTEKLEWSLDNCRAGPWRDGLTEAGAQIDGQTWDDYGNRWEKWLRQIDV
jgi:glycosyltransferase involved in cell wall biosynthesis